MINSLCGSMGTLRSENSCSKQPNSPTDSVSESNIVSDFDQNQSTLLFQGLKFETDVEVQSPDNSIWESLFTDQIDLSGDFMISSPKRMPSLNHNNYSYVQSMNGHSLLGCSPPSCSSSQIGAFSTTQKGKSPSPLQKVYQPSQFVEPESLTLPAMDGLLENFHRDNFGSYSAPKAPVCLPESFEIPAAIPAMLDCLSLPPNSRFYGPRNNVAPTGLQLNQDSGDLFQMNAFSAGLQPNIDHGFICPASTATQQEQDSGLQLVHLLLACAEAVAKEDYISTRRYLHLLNQIVSPIGDSMQRVASCFTNALTARLAAATSTIPIKTFSSPYPPTTLELKIYQILYQACPYVKFAHFTANQAIFEAFEAEERVHIIDLDILQGYQWPAFIQALAARPGGAPFLRITGVGTPPECVRETGRRLTELAHSLHVPFEFHPVGEQLENLRPHMFQRRIGEALAVNSVNRLHRVSGSAIGNLIGMIRDQAPNIVTLVEQEANHNGPYFLGRFLEALHYYSAIFDSLDATFPADSPERAKVEQYIFAPEIRNIVACEGAERVERHERLEKWRKLMEVKGFKSVALSANAVTQSKILLGLYPCDGYRLTEEKGCLLLGWQDRSLIAASAWRC